MTLPPLTTGLDIRPPIFACQIGAVVGEWVGSSSGLGFYMLHANARMQVDVMFAALAMLSLTALFVYFSVDYLLDKIIYWEPTKGL